MTGKKLILDQTLTDIADAIRAKTGDEELMTPLEMPEKIESIKGGDEAPVIILADAGRARATTATVKTVGSARPTDISGLLNGWTTLLELDMSDLDATDVTMASDMVSGCRQLNEITLPNNGFPSLTSAARMFNISRITSVCLYNFIQVVDLTEFLSGCFNLAEIDFSNADFSHAWNVTSMFQQCTKLTSLDLSNLGFTAITNAYRMFFGCSGLQTINLSNVDFSGVNSDNNFNGTFGSCSALETIITNENTRFPAVNMTYTFSYDSALSAQSMRNVFNALPIVTDKTIKLHTDVYNRLSADDIAIATAKGWTVTT